ncbi:sensor histidine kinase [Microterricola viridarii]|uniref:Oxygen sensor histidine kinase NreB n=1 Tax=Microterricola viridarii TaxID=412690 RepID=A0A1H1LAZ1_9MICO|nr:sensor histidine kinase [Microterricola viridarii]SDR71676.1 Signal transduction histidine kinase [Microterricola viridarii]
MTSRRWWDAAMIAVAALLIAVTVLWDQPDAGGEWGVLAVLAVVLLCYFSWGRRYIGGDGALPGLLYAGVLLVALGVGIALDPTFAFLQIILFPSLWVLSGSTRQAVVLNLLAIVPITLGYWAYFGPSGILSGLGASVLAVAFSLSLGAWITSIERSGAERARLLDELLAVQGQLAAANREVGVDSERARLAREIHDTIAQSLTGLVMVAQRTGSALARVTDADPADASASVSALAGARADVELMESMARDALTEARGLVAAIAPVRVESTLAEALDRLAERFERETGVQVRTELAALAPAAAAAGGGGASGALGAELDVVLLRCAQEALANVRKHARAGTASVGISRSAGQVVLTVDDDGVGPSHSPDAGAGTGFGLAGMTERLALVGGTVRLEQASPRGSRLTVTIPLAPALAPDPAPLAETARLVVQGELNSTSRSLGGKKREAQG